MSKFRERCRRALGRAGLTMMIAGVALGGVLIAPGQAAQLGPSAGSGVRPALVAPNMRVEQSCPGPAARCAKPDTAGTSPNWSGYMQTGPAGNFRSVSASWVVPSVSSTGSTTSYSSTWIGIDGNNIKQLIQTGTESDWNGATKTPAYKAWFEILPDDPNSLPQFTVAAGDNIYAQIRQETSTTWWIYLLDRNNGQSINTVQTYNGPLTSADFIQEDPKTTAGGTLLPLAHFSRVTFRNARINYDGAKFNEGQRLNMIQGDIQLTAPGLPNDEMNEFNVDDDSYTPSTPETPLFQRHSDGSIWEWTGAPCTTPSSCPGWILVDNTPADVQISVGAGTVYERHADGSIWEWLGGACTSSTFCPGWVELDNNPADVAISAGNGTVYQLHSDGTVWKSSGQACVGASCPGWLLMDNNLYNYKIAAGAGNIFVVRRDGSVWRSSGTACSSSCPGLVQLDDNNTADISVGYTTASNPTVFQRRTNGPVFESTGATCSGPGACYGWTMLDNYPATVEIAASGPSLYQLHSDGSIWESTMQSCTGFGTVCQGWILMGPASTANEITASPLYVFRRLSNGSIWQGSSAGWQEIDGYPLTAQISATNGT